MGLSLPLLLHAGLKVCNLLEFRREFLCHAPLDNVIVLNVSSLGISFIQER